MPLTFVVIGCLLMFEPETLHHTVGRNCDRVFGCCIHDGLLRGTPAIWLRDGWGFLKKEPVHVQRPGDDGHAAGDELDFENRCAGSLLDRNPAPEAAFEFELAAGEGSGVWLANSSGDCELAADTGAAATINGGPGKVELAAGLSRCDRREQDQLKEE